MTSQKSFFEYLGIADVERIHSQFFAWIFSPDCSAIDTKQKNKLLQDIFQLNSNSHLQCVHTERNGIDILIQTDKEIIIIENKIKSSQHSNQLDRYKEFCEKSFPGDHKHYYFLTLIGEDTDDKDWKRISYAHIYKHLKLLKLKTSENHTIIVKEYLIFLDRLVSVVEDFEKNASKYDMVFLDGKKKKEDKINALYKCPNEEFIAANQLETILQKSFLSVLVESIESSKGRVGDTRGEALVDFSIARNINYNGLIYGSTIQLQGDTIKFSVAIQGESISEIELIETVIPFMETLKVKNSFGYTKLNKPKKKAYVSISKRLDEHFWHKTFADLSVFLKKEIENGKSLTEQLIALIKVENAKSEGLT